MNHWQVPAHWRAIDFLSDLHLAADTPRTFAAFAAHLRATEADAVVILGDLFEAWIGDDSRHFGFEADCMQVLADTAARRVVAFMAGNRDFLFGAGALAACGVRHLPDPTLASAFGRLLLMTHGDALCLADTEYQQVRAMVRSPGWQRDFLARPLDERARIVRAGRDASEQRKAALAMGEWSDIDAATAVDWMRSCGAVEMVHGHTHRPGDEEIAPGFARHVLSDWDLDHDAPRAELLRWSAQGLARIAPLGAAL